MRSKVAADYSFKESMAYYRQEPEAEQPAQHALEVRQRLLEALKPFKKEVKQ